MVTETLLTAPQMAGAGFEVAFAASGRFRRLLRSGSLCLSQVFEIGGAITTTDLLEVEADVSGRFLFQYVEKILRQLASIGTGQSPSPPDDAYAV